MADTTKADQLRAMREANATAAQKSSREGGESRPAGTRDRPAEPSRAVTRAAPDVATFRGEASQARVRKDAGLAPGTRETKSEKRTAAGAKGDPPKPAASASVRTKSKPKSLGARGPKKGRGGRPRSGEEDKTIQAQKPWLAEKISERTWYRRRAETKS